MSKSFMYQNQLMNQPYFHQGINSNIINQSLINQISQQCVQIPMNFLYNSFRYYQNLQNNSCPESIRNNQINSYGKKRNKFTHLYQNNFPNNEIALKMNLFYQNEMLRNNYVLNQYNLEALKNQNRQNIYDRENIKENLIMNTPQNFIADNDKNLLSKESQKETKKIKNENMLNKEDDDIDIMSDYEIPNNRRFSQRSKRSNVSDNSNFSLSTQDTTKDIITFKSNKDVSLNDDDKKIIKNEDVDEIHKTNPAFENTVILCVKVKISENNFAYFKLKRFDDIFVTIQYFCEINKLDEKFIKPLIIKSLCAINTIYQVMNSKIDNEKINILKQVKEKI